MASKRGEYQEILGALAEEESSERGDLLKRLNELIVADVGYAEGFFGNSLRRTLRYISPTVGKDKDRPFDLEVEICGDGSNLDHFIVAASFRPKLDDDFSELSELFGEELIGLSRMRGYGHLITHVAVNGLLYYPGNVDG